MAKQGRGGAREGGEARERGGRVEHQGVGPEKSPDLREKAALARAACKDNLGAQLVLDAVADRRKPVGRPYAPCAPAARVHKERLALGSDVAPPVGDIGLGRDKADFAGGHGHAGRTEGLQVILGDGLRLMHIGGLMGHVGVEGAQLEGMRPVMQRDPEWRPAQPGDERGPFRVVDVEDMRVAGPAEPHDEARPPHRRRG